LKGTVPVIALKKRWVHPCLTTPQGGLQSFSAGNHLEMSQKSAAVLEFCFLCVKNPVTNDPTDVQFIMSVSPFEMWNTAE